jgi:hypothetical protein
VSNRYGWLDPLADLLIARHINTSIPCKDRELRRSMLKGAKRTWKLTERKSRCIAVVGAGASAPVLKRGDDLAKSLIQQFHVDETAVQAEHERLKRITAVDPEEFEAQLAAIGQALGSDRRVRAAISELYHVRHPTVKAYELIAHLLKHRFLDAVISMNFDELLDQSLDDELGIGEYERIVSDRDCLNIQTDTDADDYIPLYIKLHGTASEPESLRFTRESYYDSPVQVGTVAAELFEIPECVVVNVGFGMGSFDLHRLLAMPDKLWLFNLSKKRLDKKTRIAITQERAEHKKRPPKYAQRRKKDPRASSDKQVAALLKRLDKRGEKLLDKAPSVISLRSVQRHDAVVRLLGPKSGPGDRLVKLPRSLDDPRFSVDLQVRAAKPDAVYADYLYRRAVLELAMALARGHGLVSVGALAVDRGGHYFDAYRRYAGKKRAKTWRDLYTLVGFEQNEKVPDVFQAAPEILKRKDAKRRKRRAKRGEEEWLDLPELNLRQLARRTLPRVVDSPSKKTLKRNLKILEKALRELHGGAEYELHSRDDRVCAKTFSQATTLKTISAHDVYSYELIKRAAENGKSSEVDIISETGDWLLDRDEPLAECLGEVGRVRLIVAFTTDLPRLFREFPRLKAKRLQPWHHNRHMVIVRRNGEPHRALYFARHHRTPYVTPVLVWRRRDIRVLQSTFKDRWNTSTKIPRKKKRKKSGK